jgi:hypothetical protein
MKTLWQESARRELKERLGHLQVDAPARWGKFTAPQMLIHIVDALRMANGEIETRPKNLPIRFTPIKQLVVYWLPFPKGAPTAPELLNQEPGDWAENLAKLRTQIDSFGSRDPKAAWPIHPAFGKMTPKAWGVLGYRHIDHHLKQFGV